MVEKGIMKAVVCNTDGSDMVTVTVMVTIRTKRGKIIKIIIKKIPIIILILILIMEYSFRQCTVYSDIERCSWSRG